MEKDNETGAFVKDVNSDQNFESSEDHHVEKAPSYYLTASELYALRASKNIHKRKSEEVELHRGPKVYGLSESSEENEKLEEVLQNYRNSLKVQRCVKIRDCIKAEWNDELQVAVVSSLKGKYCQYMGHNMNGKIALMPEEAMFLLEKCCIEIKHNNMPMSVEQGFAVMLKEKLNFEKYQVYVFLCQQGFIVVRHQSKVVSDAGQVMKSSTKKQKKRKAGAKPTEEMPQKRLTFTGVLASNSDLNSSLSTEKCASPDNSDVLNSNEIHREIQMTVVQDEPDCANVVDSFQSINDKQDSLKSQDIFLSPDSTNKIESETNEKDTNSSFSKPQLNIDDSINNDPISSLGNENSISDIKISESEDLNKIENQIDEIVSIDKTVNEIFEKTHDVDNQNEVVIENAVDEDTNDVIIEDINKSDGSEDINVDNSFNEYESTDESIPVVCENTNSNDASLDVDVLSCSSDDNQSMLEDMNSQSYNIIEESFKEHDDEVTLVEVKKKETKPLAVIDLLSDDEQENKNSPDNNYEDSDEEIQIVKVCPVANNNKKAQANARDICSIKAEYKKEKSENSCNVKLFSGPPWEFPNLFRKNIICLRRPDPHFLPNHVRPAKESYVITVERPQHKQGKLWNSYKDMQAYQKERRNHRMSNSQNSGHYSNSPHDINYQNDSYTNQMSPFNCQENSREMGFNRSNQNYPFQPFPNPADQSQWIQRRSNGLLPPPADFGSLPFLNLPNVPNFSSSNPASLVSETHNSIYFASNMVTSMIGQPFISNNLPSRSNQPNSFSPHHQFNDFVPHSPGISPIPNYGMINKTEFPIRYPPETLLNGPRFPYSPNGGAAFDNMPPNQRRQPNFYQKNETHTGPAFPCPYRGIRDKKSWSDVKAVVEGTNTNASDSDSDIEEVPINFNSFLWSKDIQPLVKPGSKLPVSDVLKSLQITQTANLLDKDKYNDRYLPATSSLDISYDVYPPGFKYKKTAPGIPKYRIIVFRATDPLPKFSDIVVLQRKWNDGAMLQLAVVENKDVDFYSLNSINVPELTPHVN